MLAIGGRKAGRMGAAVWWSQTGGIFLETIVTEKVRGCRKDLQGGDCLQSVSKRCVDASTEFYKMADTRTAWLA